MSEVKKNRNTLINTMVLRENLPLRHKDLPKERLCKSCSKRNIYFLSCLL